MTFISIQTSFNRGHKVYVTHVALKINKWVYRMTSRLSQLLKKQQQIASQKKYIIRNQRKS